MRQAASAGGKVETVGAVCVAEAGSVPDGFRFVNGYKENVHIVVAVCTCAGLGTHTWHGA
jgi:hypothetical protein